VLLPAERRSRADLGRRWGLAAEQLTAEAVVRRWLTAPYDERRLDLIPGADPDPEIRHAPAKWR
jgi:hypothetical protein